MGEMWICIRPVNTCVDQSGSVDSSRLHCSMDKQHTALPQQLFLQLFSVPMLTKLRAVTKYCFIYCTKSQTASHRPSYTQCIDHDTPFQPPSQLPEQKNHRKLTECFLRNKTKLLMLCLFTFPHKPLPGFKCIYGGRSQPHSVYPDIPNSSWATRQTQTPTEGRKVPSSP